MIPKIFRVFMLSSPVLFAHLGASEGVDELCLENESNDASVRVEDSSPYRGSPLHAKRDFVTEKNDSQVAYPLNQICNAETPSAASLAPAPVRSHEQRVQIGGNYTYAWITPDGNDDTKGSLGGAQFLYEYRPVDFIYAATAFSYRTGNTKNGAGHREVEDFNPQARLGYTFSWDDLIDRFTLFTGVGARYMAEKVSVGNTSLHFDYTTFYVPLGFLFEQKVVDHFLIGCNFQWMPQVFPMVRIDLLDGAQWDISYQLCNFFVEVPFILSLYDDKFTVSFSPFVETWRDGKSKAKTLTNLALSLPGNKYLFTGINVNFGYSF